MSSSGPVTPPPYDHEAESVPSVDGRSPRRALGIGRVFKEVVDSFRRGRLENIETAVDKIDEDADRFRDIGTAALNRREVHRSPDLLGDWSSAHRRKLPESIFNDDGSVPVRTFLDHAEGEVAARTRTQEVYSRRGGLRVDAINKISSRITRLKNLYGDVIFDEEAVRRYLEGPGSTLSLEAKRGIRKASNEAIELAEKKERIEGKNRKVIDE